MDGVFHELQQMKKDWYEKGGDIVNIHLYVKDVEEHEIVFEENQVTVRFATKHVQFLKLHLKNVKGKPKTSFCYTIKTRMEINPKLCVYKVKAPFIELILRKKVPGKWGSLERFDIKDLDNDTNSSPTKSNQKTKSQLLGGKSTPLSQKSSEDGKQESSVKVDNQQAGSSKPSDQKNIKKAVASSTSQVESLLGLTGLENYANNCYMNVVIQILANIHETREYFKNDHFLKDINSNNPLGSGGKVAKAFSEVAKALWSTRRSAFKPAALKSIMGKRCSLFLGWQQHDAQEFFASLLDNLHEDLNQYCSENTSEKESKQQVEGEASSNEKPDTAWSVHLKRNNSFITKLFHGQLMSKLTCAACHKTSYSYDPCAQVSLPIPTYKCIYNVLLFTRDNCSVPILIVLPISTQNPQVWHLINMLQAATKIPYQHLTMFNGYSDICSDDRAPLLSLQKLKYITVSETSTKEEIDFISLPVFQYVQTPSTFVRCDSCGLGQSEISTKLKRCTRCMVVAYCSRDCQTKHWQLHSKACTKELKMQVGIPFVLTLRKEQLSYESLEKDIREKANFTVEISSKSEIASNDSNVCSNSNVNTSGNEKSENTHNSLVNSPCVIKISHELNIDNDKCIVVNRDNFSVDALSKANCLILVWSNSPTSENGDIVNVHSREIPNHQIYEEPALSSSGNDQCTLYDSLRLFMEPERLDESECWKCPKCKSLQAAKKEMAISSPPCVLLLHLKRFTYGDYGQKINKAVSYPLTGFDISPFIAKETRSRFDYPHIYDLCGVITHRGTMRMGHYTCMVRMINQQDQEEVGWRLFDDDCVTKIKKEKVVSPDAYVLVYRLRGTQDILKIDRHPILSYGSRSSLSENNVSTPNMKRKRADSVAKSNPDRRSATEQTLNRVVRRSASSENADETSKGLVGADTPPLSGRRCTSAVPPNETSSLSSSSESINLKSGSLPDVTSLGKQVGSTSSSSNVHVLCNSMENLSVANNTGDGLKNTVDDEEYDDDTFIDFGTSEHILVAKDSSNIDENDLD